MLPSLMPDPYTKIEWSSSDPSPSGVVRSFVEVVGEVRPCDSVLIFASFASFAGIVLVVRATDGARRARRSPDTSGR